MHSLVEGVPEKLSGGALRELCFKNYVPLNYSIVNEEILKNFGFVEEIYVSEILYADSLLLFIYFCIKHNNKKLRREIQLRCFANFGIHHQAAAVAAAVLEEGTSLLACKEEHQAHSRATKFNFFSFTQMSLNYCMKSKLSSLIKNFFFPSSMASSSVRSHLSLESAFFARKLWKLFALLNLL